MISDSAHRSRSSYPPGTASCFSPMENTREWLTLSGWHRAQATWCAAPAGRAWLGPSRRQSRARDQPATRQSGSQAGSPGRLVRLGKGRVSNGSRGRAAPSTCRCNHTLLRRGPFLSCGITRELHHDAGTLALEVLEVSRRRPPVGELVGPQPARRGGPARVAPQHEAWHVELARDRPEIGAQ